MPRVRKLKNQALNDFCSSPPSGFLNGIYAHVYVYVSLCVFCWTRASSSIIDYHFGWLHYQCIAHPHNFLSRCKIEHCRRL